MMREYPDPQKHIEEHLADAAERYVNGLRQRGLQPNPTLDRLFAQRVAKETEDAYMQELTETHAHNSAVIRQRYEQERKKIKREGSRTAVLICIPVAILFELVAWSNFTRHAPGYGIFFAITGLVWLALLAVKILCDR